MRPKSKIVFDSLITVVIPNFNNAKYVSSAIESVLNQTYKNLEIIVIDDGSSDDSIEVISKYAHSVRIICQKNHGVSGARNVGLSHARGSFICFLDSDDVWTENKVEKQVEVLSRNLNSCVYCGIRIVDESGSELSKILPKYKGNLQKRYLWNPGRANVLLGCSSAILPTRVAREVGGFDINLSMSADWDFFRKIADKIEIDFVDSCLVEYRQHPRNMSKGSIPQYYRDMPHAFESALEFWIMTKTFSRTTAKIARLLFLLRMSLLFIRTGNVSSLKNFFTMS